MATRFVLQSHKRGEPVSVSICTPQLLPLRRRKLAIYSLRPWSVATWNPHRVLFNRVWASFSGLSLCLNLVCHRASALLLSNVLHREDQIATGRTPLVCDSISAAS